MRWVPEETAIPGDGQDMPRWERALVLVGSLPGPGSVDMQESCLFRGCGGKGKNRASFQGTDGSGCANAIITPM